MIQMTKTAEGGVLLEDLDAGESVQLSWEDVGQLIVFIEEDLGRVAVREARPVRDALERGIALERAELDEAR